MAKDFEWVSKKEKDVERVSLPLATRQSNTPKKARLYLNIFFNYVKYLLDLALYKFARLIYMIIKSKPENSVFFRRLSKGFVVIFSILALPVFLLFKYMGGIKLKLFSLDRIIIVQTMKGFGFLSVLLGLGACFSLIEGKQSLINIIFIILGGIFSIWFILEKLKLIAEQNSLRPTQKR